MEANHPHIHIPVPSSIYPIHCFSATWLFSLAAPQQGGWARLTLHSCITFRSVDGLRFIQLVLSGCMFGLFPVFNFYKYCCFQWCCTYIFLGFCQCTFGIIPTGCFAGSCRLLRNKAYVILLDVAPVLSTGIVAFCVSVSSVYS